MNAFLKVSSSVLAVFLMSQVASARTCPAPWKSAVGNAEDCGLQEFEITTRSGWTGARRTVKAKIRSGYLAENPNTPFRGNVIYYEGLGDSMVNHMPLFQKLTDAGYRVIAFDYMGQGGSGGKMNDTRIYEIGVLGDKIWKMHARDLADYPKKNIIGWSTGGLAAYIQASRKADVNNIVLIAPGIAPRVKVGEQNILEFKFNQITLASLTTDTYGKGVENPHIDPIKPRSPLNVMDFSWDLLTTARSVRRTSMDKRVNGFVLLSGEEDTYVNAEKTRKTLAKVAPHFSVIEYAHALHEIDNEVESIRTKAHADILRFLNLNN